MRINGRAIHRIKVTKDENGFEVWLLGKSSSGQDDLLADCQLDTETAGAAVEKCLEEHVDK